MDSATQSAQISSSQGLADGHNSAAKESKQPDSFLSSSTVSLIQSPQDKGIVLGSDGPGEGVATSLRFPSKTGSFTLDNYGKEAGPPDEQPDSPIKTSPVSERIKALEALVAQSNQPDFRSDRGFFHVRDYHSEKFSIDGSKYQFEKITPTKTTKEVSDKQPSLYSPPGVLGDLEKMNEFEETEEWMKAHLPPVPNFDAVDMTLDDAASKAESKTDEDVPDDLAVFAGDSIVDSPVNLLNQKDTFCDKQAQPSVEEKSEIHLGFLPTDHNWGQMETSEDSNSATEKPTRSGDSEPPEVSEAESSGESEDTVIEDLVPGPCESSDVAVLNNSATVLTSTTASPTEVKDLPPPPSERKLMQVPTINVIETDEPQNSDGEMEFELEEVEDYDEVVKEQCGEVPKSSEPDSEDSENEPTGIYPTETEFMEVYSPPSSPAASDSSDHSPEHEIVEGLADSFHPEFASKPEPSFAQSILKDSEPDLFQAPCGNKPNSLNNENADSADNDKVWSDEAQDVMVETDTQFEATSYSSSKVDDQNIKTAEDMNIRRAFVSRALQDDFYERQSFDSDYGVSSALDCIDCTEQISAKEKFLSGSSQVVVGGPSANTAENEPPEDDQNKEDLISGNEDEDYSQPATKALSRDSTQDLNPNNQSKTVVKVHEQDLSETLSPDIVCDKMEDPSISELKTGEEAQQDGKMTPVVPDTQNTNPTDSKNPDSFVDFMRECLKSTHDEEDQDESESEDWLSKKEVAPPSSHFTPTVVMDLEQEELTISLLKELGSNQDDETVPLLSGGAGQDNVYPISTSPKHSPVTAVSDPACSKSTLVLDDTYSKRVEAIDKWVAEAYHLTEHVLMAIITHLSVKDLIHWRDPKKSGIVFGVSLLVLLSLAAFSVISVVSYLLLALLCVTITFRIYKSVVQAIQKSSEGHPFKALIDLDVSVPPETFRKHVDTGLTYINRGLKQMTRLFLVEDLVDSLKLAVVMWLLTYVGAVFNGITILILADILLFAIPPVYEKNKTQIDQYIDLVRTQVNTTMAKLQEKLPAAMKRNKTD